MIQSLLPRPCCASWLRRRGGLRAAISAATLLLASAASAASAAPVPYPQAVTNGELAARAVLARAGRETCLRGKLTRALLGLSNSCEASGTRNPLCTLADQAVVVTPMSLTFMDETSHQLLELIHPGGAGIQASARRVETQPEQPQEP